MDQVAGCCLLMALRQEAGLSTLGQLLHQPGLSFPISKTGIILSSSQHYCEGSGEGMARPDLFKYGGYSYNNDELEKYR